ncbi:P-loop ATPase, Sll1717 family [Minwuia sp.]|uniref:P-loop ATPase, Sll1717 family n=1 Tax=Minwuia sp. TaxID=2493630 RepID=UPI003A8E1192
MINFDDNTLHELFGAEDAENESRERLKSYFFRNKAYENLTSGRPIRVLVGHKGVGKSALLKVAYYEDVENNRMALWIQPNELRGIATESGGDLNSLIESWKHKILSVIYTNICENFIETKGRNFNENIGKTAKSLFRSIDEILRKRGGNVQDIVSNQIIDRYMNKGEIIVYIDDLDRGWEARREDIVRISALLNAIRDLVGSEEKLKFRLGLRSDVYYLVRTSDESTDKIERQIIPLIWNNHEILVMFAKRIESYFGRSVNEGELICKQQREVARYFDPVIESRFQGMGKWENVAVHRVLLSLTRKRPRDLVKLLYGSGREAQRNGHSKIATMDLRGTFEAYSGERLQDIINEFRSELQNIEQLIYGMKPNAIRKRKKEELKTRTSDNYLFTNDQLVTKIKNIMRQANFAFVNGNRVDANSLAEFLYKIDFITARVDDDGHIIRRFFDQNRILQNQFTDFGFNWEIHPAYRWALQPTDVRDIFRKLDLEGRE